MTSPRDKHAAYHPVDKPSFNPPPQAPAEDHRVGIGGLTSVHEQAPTLEDRVLELERRVRILEFVRDRE